MSCRPLMLASLAGVALISASAGTGSAQSILLETTYLPTSTIVSSPLATSYVVPTTYSTAYVPTSYLSTGYVTTGRYRPRRFVERTSYFASPVYSPATTAFLSPTSYVLPTTYLAGPSYVPTSYISSPALLPTTYLSSPSIMPTGYISSSSILPTAYVLDSGLIATSLAVASSSPCDSSPAPVQPTTTRQTVPPPSNTGTVAGAITSKPTSTSTERNPSAAMGDPADDRPDSSVKPATGGSTAQQQVPAAPSPAGAGDANTPPAAPVLEEKKPDDMPIPKPGDIGAPGPKASETQYRARKPTSYTASRNILKGRVVSYESGRPEEGVTVVVSNVTNAYTDRTAMTDADGDFKLSLPEGDWTVKVQMPSGRILAVGREYVTATSGKVTDSAGRNVKELVITR